MSEVPLYSFDSGPVEGQRTLWVYGLSGHMRRQGYEASNVDSRRPRKYIRGSVQGCLAHKNTHPPTTLP